MPSFKLPAISRFLGAQIPFFQIKRLTQFAARTHCFGAPITSI